MNDKKFTESVEKINTPPYKPKIKIEIEITVASKLDEQESCDLEKYMTEQTEYIMENVLNTDVLSIDVSINPDKKYKKQILKTDVSNELKLY